MTAETAGPAFGVVPGQGGLPRLALAAPDGARAEIYLHGAHVTSWIPASGGERLFLSRRSEFRSGAAIRGGVPVIFPQFSDLGPLPKHGFARTLPWEPAAAPAGEDGAVTRLRLRDSEASRRLWPQAFLAELTVVVSGERLAVTLAVTNTGTDRLTFTAALHTYLAVGDSGQTTVEGLEGLRYRDTAAGGVEGREDAPRLGFKGEVDRIYFDAPAELRVVEPGRTLTVTAAGFPDVVVWNPGAAKGAALADLEADGYRRFLCVEAAAIGRPVSVAPGERWQGTQTLAA